MLSPADYCREDWHCLICGAPKEELESMEDFFMEWVRCGRCYFRYTLKIPLVGSKKRYVPMPVLKIKWRRCWARAWKWFHDPAMIDLYFNKFDTPEQANNAMNRLDGGSVMSSERSKEVATNGRN